jgi:hypothetical protein
LHDGQPKAHSDLEKKNGSFAPKDFALLTTIAEESTRLIHSSSLCCTFAIYMGEGRQGKANRAAKIGSFDQVGCLATLQTLSVEQTCVQAMTKIK